MAGQVFVDSCPEILQQLFSGLECIFNAFACGVAMPVIPLASANLVFASSLLGCMRIVESHHSAIAAVMQRQALADAMGFLLGSGDLSNLELNPIASPLFH